MAAAAGNTFTAQYYELSVIREDCCHKQVGAISPVATGSLKCFTLFLFAANNSCQNNLIQTTPAIETVSNVHNTF